MEELLLAFLPSGTVLAEARNVIWEAKPLSQIKKAGSSMFNFLLYSKEKRNIYAKT